ncbi:hypothetical protein MLD38_003816 [Melastoma candidum]|uniref:Uncharacterized protein n=1 Tax=Melastoma candidum TaxID=119954 RepID=A0ACB9S5A2_9MYRT|nr:hypothetical protein MLD38_003816 [Melastoma candidum]
MIPHCDLEIHINGLHTFFLHESVMSTYCGKLEKVTGQGMKMSQIELPEFPGGLDGFELVSMFCYNGGAIPITVSNVSNLYCSAIFLGMMEKVSSFNLVRQTEIFLESMADWPWTDVIDCLKSAEAFLEYADSVGLIERLVCMLRAKLALISDVNGLVPSSSSSSSSPEVNPGTRFLSSGRNTPEQGKSSSTKAYWFDGLAILSPEVMEKILKSLGAYGAENMSLIFTNFLLHYLKNASQIKSNYGKPECYAFLADTAVHGVIIAGKAGKFTCRGLFRVLRTVSGFGLSKDCRTGLERLIGEMLDQASLDDILVSGHERGNIYNVDLVTRLIRVFVSSEGTCSWSSLRTRKVARLVDIYLGEIAPDQNLKVSKFLSAAESLPDPARECFDGVCRAIDIFLESHQGLTFDERSRLCRCLNYEKLSLEACKELAKNPKVPPAIAVQALMAQQSRLPTQQCEVLSSPMPTPRRGCDKVVARDSPRRTSVVEGEIVAYDRVDMENIEEENRDMRMNLQRMQWRVVELEKVCKEMKGRMSRMVRHPTGGPGVSARALPRLC